ncbi:MAG TPA: DUF6249 domain-containing protein [Candidatus Binatia bacterium]|jgi:hypothetical protein|nr:DUF6249 domain-containing protein [Candidatus Binatia bacterium]
MTKNVPSLKVLALLSWLVLPLAGSSVQAQNVNVNLGGNAAQNQKATQELAEKLPPDKAADFLKSQDAWETVGATLQWMLTAAIPLGIVALVLTFRYRRQKVAHETMRLMIEKGLPVPPEMINPPPPIKPPRSDLRRGLIWLGLGFGLALSSLKLAGEGFWTLGLIPVFIGVAYLICWRVTLLREKSECRQDSLWLGLFWTLFGVATGVAMLTMNNANGDWDKIGEWWGFSLIPTGVGVAFLLHKLVTWLISRKKSVQT